MRTFEQKELNQFILNHIREACQKYLLVRDNNEQEEANYYYAQMLSYHNMAIAFADNETFIECCDICNKALEIEL